MNDNRRVHRCTSIAKSTFEAILSILHPGCSTRSSRHRCYDSRSTRLTVRQTLLALVEGLDVIALTAIFGEAVFPERIHGDLEASRVGRYGLVRLQRLGDLIPELYSLSGPD